MDIFYSTKIPEYETSDFDEQDTHIDIPYVELEELQVSEGESIEVDNFRLKYFESNTQDIAKKDERRVDLLKELLLLPSETQYLGIYLLNEADNGKFIKIRLPNGSTYFVKFRSLKIGDEQERKSPYNTIVTSQCIFGFGGTRAELEDGSVEIFRSGKLVSSSSYEELDDRQIVAWHIDEKISLYELEALLRKTTFINGLMSEGTEYGTVIFTNPRVEYYLAGLDLFEKGYMSSEMLLEWFNIVDRRVNRIDALTKARLDKRLSIKIKSPLDELREYLRNKTIHSSMPRLEEAVVILSQDSLWRVVLELGHPDSWVGLVSLAIAVEELRNTFLTGSGAVVVKSPKQESTFGISTALAKLINHKSDVRFNMMAMYPQERITVSHKTPRRKLLSYVPEPISITTAKKVIRTYGPI